jgi:hypothetical protein
MVEIFPFKRSCKKFYLPILVDHAEFTEAGSGDQPNLCNEDVLQMKEEQF